MSAKRAFDKVIVMINGKPVLLAQVELKQDRRVPR